MAKLTPKQQRFVDEYLVDLNATQAAIRAGYTAKFANTNARKLLQNTTIATAIQDGVDKRLSRTEITQDAVLKELAKIGFANMMDYMSIDKNGDPFVDFSALTRDQAAAISEVVIEEYKEGGGDDAREVKRVKFKLMDKRAALVDIGKHLGMFVERKLLGNDPDNPLTPTKDMIEVEVDRRIAELERKAGR